MLATCEAYNSENYRNCTKVGLPVPPEDGVGHTYHKMIDVDAPDHKDKAFDCIVGTNDVWELWTKGWFTFRGKTLTNGKRSKKIGTKTPVTGRYGYDKHTLVAELPNHFGNKYDK